MVEGLEDWDGFPDRCAGVERWFEHNKPTRQSKDKFFLNKIAQMPNLLSFEPPLALFKGTKRAHLNIE